MWEAELAEKEEKQAPVLLREQQVQGPLLKSHAASLRELRPVPGCYCYACVRLIKVAIVTVQVWKGHCTKRVYILKCLTTNYKALLCMQMRERLEALEAIVKDMQTQLERPATDVQPERGPQQSTGKHD